MLNKNTIIQTKEFIRWNDWALDKLPVLFGICFYLIVIKPEPNITYVYDFFVFLIFSISSTIYGYAINNYADLDIDIKAGKKNYLAAFSRKKQWIILFLILIVVLISGSYFLDKSWFTILWVSQFFFATFYSIRPIRFKERGLIGLLIPFVAQLVLPTLICFSIFGNIYSFEAILFTTYGFFKGGAYDIGHQFHDFQDDQKTNTLTFTVKHGGKIVQKLFNTFLILERLLFLVILLSIVFLNKFQYSYLFGLLVIAYLILLVLVINKEIKEGKISDPYYIDFRGYSNLLHIIIPNIGFPLLLAILLFLMDPIYIFFLIFFIIWIFPTPSKLLWPVRLLLSKSKY
jgi:4-hydroxybenzoate polyprenyltransferase